MSKTENIYNTTLEIIDYAANGITTHQRRLPLLKPHRSKKIENSKIEECCIALKTVTFFSINETKLAAKSLFDVLILF
jgi:hypothetical protein